ncbi:plasmid mobilization protein [Paraburkholderia humisilvae]|nr:hypothetical protein [Paraburkholderia humisilvae]
MNKPSERIVVFVSPAQKRAITATAEELGISISELMRRAVLNFGATSEQVRAASIVDRLRAPREPDALNEALQRVARSTKHGRAALPAALAPKDASVQRANGTTLDAGRDNAAQNAADLAPVPIAPPQAWSDVAAADDTPQHAQAADAQAAAEAAARVAAAKAMALKAKAKSTAGAAGCDDSAFIDPAEGTGRFA